MQRRHFLKSALLGAAASLPVSHTAMGAAFVDATSLGAVPNGSDNTVELQTAINQAAAQNLPLYLSPGTYFATALQLPQGATLKGVPGQTILTQIGTDSLLSANNLETLNLSDIILDGGVAGSPGTPLVSLSFINQLNFKTITIRNSRGDGLVLHQCAGMVHQNRFLDIGGAALFAQNSKGLTIRDNHLNGAADNGILVWRDVIGEDGTIVTNNHIANIDFKSGGNGQNGNGINIFRANNVIATGNHMTDCALSALRINSANNSTIANNQARRIGEVAFYAEFAFDGVLFAHNLIDEATVGISVTNANDGGQMGVVTGNMVRNLRARSTTNPDALGSGIAVERNAIVADNILDNIAGTAIGVGWGEYRDNLIVKDNLVQRADIGIGISGAPGVQHASVTGNHIIASRMTPIAHMLWDKIDKKDITKPPRGDAKLVLRDNLIS